MGFAKRTHTCGELREQHEGSTATINGWVAQHRDYGGVLFVDIRDRYGITQVVFVDEASQEASELARKLHYEDVVSITGNVRKRENPNDNIPTGQIEILATSLEVLNRAATPPFEVREEVKASEELRLKYRYLDLRRRALQKNFIIRNQLYQVAHKYFEEQNFLEVETPVLMKSTPEGARDYLVPSRLHRGQFYALPQSPQIYKQILMMSGFDRYMQIVKCFRDEDLRADRQPEFSQIDIEMSFVDELDIYALIEEFIKRLWKDVLDIEITAPFRQISWHQAMTTYGSDKPDTRLGMEITTLSELAKTCGFGVFANAVNDGGDVAAICAKGCAGYSRKQIDGLTDVAKRYGAGGLAWMKVKEDGELQSPIAKFFSDDELKEIVAKTGAEAGDLILFGSADFNTCYTVLGALRLEIAKQTGLAESVKGNDDFLWVVDFPLLEFDADSNRYIALHHPFVQPKAEDVDKLNSDPASVSAIAYDLVINGYEAGGGSIRIHDQSIQAKVFELLAMSEEEAEDKFGFLLEALKYGAPPHGGIALGLDRLAMILARTENIRDVVAFPKTTSALSLMDDAPSGVSEEQLKELGISIVTKD